jgi:AcrR family transcriptional regulator
MTGEGAYRHARVEEPVDDDAADAAGRPDHEYGRGLCLIHAAHENVTGLKTQPGHECYCGRVSEPTGLRARKKERTRDAIGDAAVALFLEHGFDRVSVNDIAAAAEISKPTLFRYFPTKEDLVLHRFADHQGEAARVVRDRRPGARPVTALHRHFRAALDRYDPVTGLNDHPAVVAFHGMVFATPSLAGRLVRYQIEDEEALADALGEGITGRLQAAQILAVQRVLARANWQKIADGRTARDVHPEAAADADHAFGRLW